MSIRDRREPKVALPKGWPRLAKSAIVHAIALAHFVVTHVRGWYPEFLRDIVGRIKATFPLLGTQRIANMLARAGLHVARTTVRRLLKRQPGPPAPVPAAASVADKQPSKLRRLISRGPNHTWLVDITVMPTSAGFWVPWVPGALLQRWPSASSAR